MSERAPAGLSVSAKRLWKEAVDGFIMSPAELRVLENLCTAQDRVDQARAIIEREGLVVLDRYGVPKANPACDLEAKNKVLVARFVAQLGLRSTVETIRAGAKPGPRQKRRPLREVG